MAGALQSGQLAWITGASSGIGEALSFALADRGLRLVLSARREHELERVRENLPRPDEAIVVPLDMTQPDQFAEAAARVHRYGGIDWMVHNAGRSQRSLALDTAPENERALIETNYFGPVGLTRAVLPEMIARGCGQIVVISSVLGHFSIPRRSSYCASKHALHGYFNSLRSEIEESSVGVTMICPGYVATPLAEAAEWGPDTPRNDESNDRGLSPEECAVEIVRAMDQRKLEAHIGGKEKLGITLSTLFPKRWARYINKMI